MKGQWKSGERQAVVRREGNETPKTWKSELQGKNLGSTQLKGLENTDTNKHDSHWRTE